MALQQAGSAEPFADGILAGMTKRWVPDIVGKTGSGDIGAEIAGLARRLFLVLP